MKKFLLSMIALVAMYASADNMITVPAELNGWYASVYVASNQTIEVLKNGIDGWVSIDGLDGGTWTDDQQAALEKTTHWGVEDDPYSFFGQISNGRFFVGGDLAVRNYYSFLIVNGDRLAAGNAWRIYVAHQHGDCTLTQNDLYLQGVFGRGITTGVTDVEVADADQNKAKKIVENGQILIVKNGVKYNVQGRVIK
ncbi:MAG: hypothetical protein Q4B68_07355 [Bacteroidales bacterium]|nr:hypothetical protein [Bacteroidales bacterium]